MHLTYCCHYNGRRFLVENPSGSGQRTYCLGQEDRSDGGYHPLSYMEQPDSNAELSDKACKPRTTGMNWQNYNSNYS